jgi:superfamily II DNA/RNA helicase
MLSRSMKLAVATHVPMSDCAVQSRHMFACAPTGSGKTMAYALPILMSLKVRLC